MQFVKGPDFPTGALIMGRQGILDAYRTGKGSIRLRAVAEIEEGTAAPTSIVVTEMPYQTSISATAAAHQGARRDPGRSRASPTSTTSRPGARPASSSSCKQDAPGLVVLNNLYKHTPLQTNFSVNTVALVDGVPRTLNLRAGAAGLHRPPGRGHPPPHRVPPAARPRSELHIREGRLKALNVIDQIIATIRASDDRAAAKVALDGRAVRVQRAARPRTSSR